MTPVQRLAIVQTKIDRARRHLQELETEVQSFFDGKPYVVGAKPNSHTQRIVYYLTHVQDTPPSFSLITGDVLHNLRSALDNLAYQLVSVGTRGRGPFHHVYFPISDSEVKYKDERMRKVKGMRQDAINAIDNIRPYKGGNDLLWQLHKLNIIDKHRLLITVGSAYQSVNIGQLIHPVMVKLAKGAGFDEDAEMMPILDVFVKPKNQLFPLKKGKILLNGLPEEGVVNGLQFQFSVVFGERGILEGEPISKVLYDMTELVDNIVIELKPFLG